MEMMRIKDKAGRWMLSMWPLVALGGLWLAGMIAFTSREHPTLVGEWHSIDSPGAHWTYPTTLRFDRQGHVQVTVRTPTGEVREAGTYRESGNDLSLSFRDAAGLPPSFQPTLRSGEPFFHKIAGHVLELNLGERTYFDLARSGS